MGGAFSLVRTSLKDTGSTYIGNGAKMGGAIYCDTCTLKILQPNFD